MTSIAFVSATTLPLEHITHAFNLGFSGYFLPMTQTPDGLAQMMRENDVRLSDSLVLYIDDALAGVGLVGVRGARGWIAGMGVAPQWRGQGIGAQLLGRLLAHMTAIGLRQAQLEVLDVNIPALTLYQRMGFRVRRSLTVYHGPLHHAAPAAPDAGADGRRIHAVAPRLAYYGFDAYHPVMPAWQRERATLERIRSALDGLGLWDNAQLVAYLLYSRQVGGFAILDGGSSAPLADARRDDLARLLRALDATAPHAIFRAINTPTGDPLGAALDALGCPVAVTQREMIRELR